MVLPILTSEGRTNIWNEACGNRVKAVSTLDLHSRIQISNTSHFTYLRTLMEIFLSAWMRTTAFKVSKTAASRRSASCRVFSGPGRVAANRLTSFVLWEKGKNGKTEEYYFRARVQLSVLVVRRLLQEPLRCLSEQHQRQRRDARTSTHFKPKRLPGFWLARTRRGAAFGYT